MTDDAPFDSVPRWALAIGPIVILAAVLGVLYVSSPFGNVESMSDASTLEVLWMLTIVGAIAGIVPVAIGMLWFPFIRALDHRYLHAFLALAAGVLVFIAFEMTEEVFEHSAEAEHTGLALGLAALAILGTFAVMYAVSEWRQRTAASGEKSGLQIAYLVAIALGLHSIGEGMGIGVAFVLEDATLVTLLVLGYIMHNVMEGPTVVAAVARDRATPPLRHFAAMGLIAGGPVILGGWIGSLANSNLLAAVFFAIAVGAILQVLIEMAQLIRFDAEAVMTRLNVATFLVGVGLMFLLEDVIVGGWVLPG